MELSMNAVSKGGRYGMQVESIGFVPAEAVRTAQGPMVTVHFEKGDITFPMAANVKPSGITGVSRAPYAADIPAWGYDSNTHEVVMRRIGSGKELGRYS